MIVEVKQGRLEGSTKKSVLTGQEYYCFLGIPYAKPPTGELRFQPPQPIEKWDGTLNAKNYGSPCVQKNFIGGYDGSEDCLYLNVYTPSPFRHDDTKAVMVFIHGGAFLNGSGSSDAFSPDYLLNYDVILVTLNYRLHVLGFLSMDTKDTASNCGLRDQCLALTWIKANIKQFGGDPENITIFGESSGACSVHFQLISPMSRGLFNKAILQSDIGYSTFRDATYSLNPGFVIAKKLGCSEEDPEKVVEFLRKQSAEDLCREGTWLFEAIKKREIEGCLANTFAPSLEIGRENSFLPDTIENLQQIAIPVPLIVGFNNHEGKLEISIFTRNRLEELQNDFSLVIERRPQFHAAKFSEVCDKIKEYYLGDEPINEKTAGKIVDLYTNYWMRHFHESYDFVLNSNIPVYVYEFSFFGKFNIFEKLFLNFDPPLGGGANHADELPYLFYPEKLLPDLTEFTEPELTVIKNICSMWTNFAKNGDPTSNFANFKWKPSTLEEPCFIRIDKDLELVEGKLRKKELEFWQKLLNME